MTTRNAQGRFAAHAAMNDAIRDARGRSSSGRGRSRRAGAASEMNDAIRAATGRPTSTERATLTVQEQHDQHMAWVQFERDAATPGKYPDAPEFPDPGPVSYGSYDQGARQSTRVAAEPSMDDRMRSAFNAQRYGDRT